MGLNFTAAHLEVYGTYMPEDFWLTHEQLKEVIYFCKRPPSQISMSPLVTL